MNPAAATLEAILQGEAACAETLLATLNDEHAALLANDVERLRGATDAKLQALKRVEACGRQREALLGGRTPPPESAAGRLWEKLLDVATRCRDRNQANAALLDARRARTLWALRYLGVTTPLYGRYGQTPSVTTQRVLARA
ncbi:MAG: flagellar protein FlgN [Gammaproteobacteria bacterium]|nr:flagellar protein FlgN [Gammaproteobacteria bacterium]